MTLASSPLGARDRVRVSRLGLGGAAALMNQYGPVSDRDAETIIRTAVGQGITLFDTAPAYGDRLSERRLGKALEGRDVFLATKVGFYADGSSYRVDVSAAATRRSLEASLRLLRRRRLDLVQLHELTDDTWSEAMGANGAVRELERARDEGLVRFVGLTGSRVDPLLRGIRTGRFDTLMVWKIWNLLDRSGEALLTEAHERGLGTLVGGPFASGVLATGVVDAGLYHYRVATPVELERVRELEQIARGNGRSLRDEALGFCLDDRVSCVVAATANPEHVRSNVAATAAWLASGQSR